MDVCCEMRKEVLIAENLVVMSNLERDKVCSILGFDRELPPTNASQYKSPGLLAQDPALRQLGGVQSVQVLQPHDGLRRAGQVSRVGEQV